MKRESSPVYPGERIRFRATATEDISAGAMVTGVVDRETGTILIRNAQVNDHINAPSRLTPDPEPEWEGFNESMARARSETQDG